MLPSEAKKMNARHLSRRCNARRRLWVVSLTLAISIGVIRPVWTNGPRFYDDDPILREPESQDASAAQPTEIGLLFDLTHNLFVSANHKPSNTRALNVNTIDEVPDSSWFTNRIGAGSVTGAELARGPATGPAPAPERWVIVRDKSAGANPGFTAKDANGETWFLGFDRPSNPEGPSAAVVV